MPRIYRTGIFADDTVIAAIEQAYYQLDYHRGGQVANWFLGGGYVETDDIPAMNIKAGEPGMLRGVKPETWYADPDTKKFIEFKMVRLLRKVCDQEFDDKQWEMFGNYLLPRIWPTFNFELIRGRGVRAAYHENNYARNAGTLDNSCMRYDSCKSYFQTYWRNPEVCGLLVSKDEADKINGRCLVWTTTDGTIVADRVYGNNATIKAIEKYAHEQGWWIRGIYSSDTPTWVKPNGDKIEKHMQVQLGKYDFQSYPYMDTFRALDIESGILSTSVDDGRYSLSSTHGGWDDMGPRFVCPCGQGFRRYNGVILWGDRNPSLCMRCGQDQTAQCLRCNHRHMRDDMVEGSVGAWYCQNHIPERCTICTTPITGQQYNIEGSATCVHCLNEYYRDEEYRTADGHRLNRSQYEDRLECNTCHRYWSYHASYDVPLSSTTNGYECYDCRSERRAREQAVRDARIATELTALDEWIARYGSPEVAYMAGCSCEICRAYEAAMEATAAALREQVYGRNLLNI